MAEVLLSARSLTKHFSVPGPWFARRHKMLRALDGVDLDINLGETVGVVGESGCGKSTLGRCLIRLIEPTSGEILFRNVRIDDAAGARLRQSRSQMQMIFQDPLESLDPHIRIGDAIREGLELQGLGTPAERRSRVVAILDRVGLPVDLANRYPHEISGGQQQRVVIARALVLNPALVVADEPVSALDVSVRSQILNLLVSLRVELGLTYLLISHDVSVVGYMADRIAVMYLGKIVEIAPTQMLLREPLHPYSVALLSSVLRLEDGPAAPRVVLVGEVPSPIDIPSGCRFRTRCPIAKEICSTQEPPLLPATGGASVACHFPGSYKAPSGPDPGPLSNASDRTGVDINGCRTTSTSADPLPERLQENEE